MNSISRLDRLMAQLRTQLQRRANAPIQESSGAAALVGRRVEAVAGLKAAGVSDKAVLARCLIEGLLRDEFGDDMVNNAEFHQMIGSVLDVFMDDEQAWAMCRAYIDQA